MRLFFIKLFLFLLFIPKSILAEHIEISQKKVKEMGNYMQCEVYFLLMHNLAKDKKLPNANVGDEILYLKRQNVFYKKMMDYSTIEIHLHPDVFKGLYEAVGEKVFELGNSENLIKVMKKKCDLLYETIK